MREGLSGWYATTEPPVCEPVSSVLVRRLDCGIKGVHVVGNGLVALTYRVWPVCTALATGTGRWRGGTAQPWDHPLTHRDPTAIGWCEHFQRPVPVTPGQHLLCTRLITWGGGDDRRPVSSPDTPSLDPTPLLCDAKRSYAKLWPCPTPCRPPSLVKPPGTHAPAAAWRARAQAAPSTDGAWGVEGPGESKAPRQDKTRGEERGVLGRRKGLHLCTSPGRGTGDMGRARGHPHRTLQPLMTMDGLELSAW
jgi:hypothetical protein